jgi:hypothetical protein
MEDGRDMTDAGISVEKLHYAHFPVGKVIGAKHLRDIGNLNPSFMYTNVTFKSTCRTSHQIITWENTSKTDAAVL